MPLQSYTAYGSSFTRSILLYLFEISDTVHPFLLLFHLLFILCLVAHYIRQDVLSLRSGAGSNVDKPKVLISATHGTSTDIALITGQQPGTLRAAVATY